MRYDGSRLGGVVAVLFTGALALSGCGRGASASTSRVSYADDEVLYKLPGGVSAEEVVGKHQEAGKAGPSDRQVALLQDGVVTYSEYREAIRAASACISTSVPDTSVKVSALIVDKNGSVTYTISVDHSSDKSTTDGQELSSKVTEASETCARTESGLIEQLVRPNFGG